MTASIGQAGSRKPLSTVEFVALFSFITSLTAASIDGMLPALGIIGVELNVADPRNTQLVITLFVLGMVFGEFLFGPLSDAIGRRKAILLGLAIFCVGSILAMTAQSIEMMLLGRVIQGFGVSGPKIGSRALIRDKFSGDAMARMISYIYMTFILVPMLAPAAGQLIVSVASWRAIFFAYLLMGLIVSIWLMMRQEETLVVEHRVPLSFGTLARNTWLVVNSRKVMAYILALGLAFGGLLLYLSIAQSVFQDIYGVGTEFPLYFATLALGVGIASFSNSQLVMRFGMERLSLIALSGMSVVGAALLAMCLLHDGQPPFVWFMIFVGALLFCFSALFNNLNSMAMQSLGRVAGLGTSLVSSISSLVAVVIAVSLGRFYDLTLYPLAGAFLLAGAGGIILVILARSGHSEPV